MREFKTNRSGLRSLNGGTRYIYTLFLGFCWIGLIGMGAMAWTRSGFSVSAIGTHFAGDDSQMKYAKTFGELIETTHMHLFSMPVLLLILGHVFLMTGWGIRAKMIIVTASFLSALGYILFPWLIAYVSVGFAWGLLLSRAGLGICLLIFLTVPLWEMWRPRKPNGGP